MAKVFVSRELEDILKSDDNMLSLGHDIIDKLGNEHSDSTILVSSIPSPSCVIQPKTLLKTNPQIYR